MSMKSRLQKLEVKVRGGMPPQVADWLDAELYFDDLTPEQQAIYCQYRWDATQPPMKYLAGLVPGCEYTDHFKLDRKPPPPTRAELEAAVREVAEYMEKASEEYAEEQAAKKEGA